MNVVLARWQFAFTSISHLLLLTESGRQRSIIQGIVLTTNAVSPSVSTTGVAISLAGFVLLYVVLAVVDLLLMLR